MHPHMKYDTANCRLIMILSNDNWQITTQNIRKITTQYIERE